MLGLKLNHVSKTGPMSAKGSADLFVYVLHIRQSSVNAHNDNFCLPNRHSCRNSYDGTIEYKKTFMSWCCLSLSYCISREHKYTWIYQIDFVSTENENGDVHIAYPMEYAPGYEWCGLASLSDLCFEGAWPKMYIFWVICSDITTYGIAWILSVAVESSWDRNKDDWNKNKNVL